MGRQRQSVRQTREVVTEEELYTPGFSMSFHAVADHAVLDIWALDLTRERGCVVSSLHSWFCSCGFPRPYE